MKRRHEMSLVEKIQLDYSVAIKHRDQHDNGTDEKGDDPGWSFYEGVTHGLRMAATEIGVRLDDD